MRRTFGLLGLATVVAALAAGCGATASPTTTHGRADGPGLFMTRILREEIRGQWSRQWGELHPGHQRLISRAQYVACSQRMGTNFARGDEVFRVLDVRNEAIDVKGVPQRQSKLVTINFHERGKQNGLTYHMHAVSVHGRWTWILGVRFLNALARGQCLDGSPLSGIA